MEPLRAPRTEAYLADLRARFPGLRIIEKDTDAFSHAVDRALRVVTFGAQRRYLSDYVTTLGRRIYLPAGFHERSDEARYIVLRHEAVHLRQFERWGLAGMTVLYLLPLLPLGLAVGRTWLEWEAYAETLRATAEVHGVAAARDPLLHEHIVRQFTSGAYGWMWPFPGAVHRWIGRVVDGLSAP